MDKKDSISIETQIDYCRAGAGGEDVRVYRDKGYTGSNLNRPAFRQLLSDIKKGEISKVIIYKLDRMSRSLMDFSKLIDLFRHYGVEFQSTQEKFDTSTPIGNAMLSITMVFAQLERETIQQRIRDNYYSRGQKGMYLGGKPPFGFRKAETIRQGTRTSMLVPFIEESAVVERIFSMFADGGMSLGEIGRVLNKENESGEGTLECTSSGRQGRLFYAGNLNRIIRNPVYARADTEIYDYFRMLGCHITSPMEDFSGLNGCYLYGKRSRGQESAETSGRTLSVAPHEGLVEAELWLRAQARLDLPNRIFPAVSRSATGGISWLGGLAVCGFCGSHMSVKSAVNREKSTGEVKARYSYLSCNGRKYGSCTVPLPKRGLSAEEVECAVEEQLLFLIQSAKLPAWEPEHPRNGKTTALQLELAKIGEEIRNLVAAVSSGSQAAGKYLNSRLEELDDRKSVLEAELAGMRRNEDRDGEIQLSEVFRHWTEFPISLKRRLSRLLIGQITIFHREEYDELHIQWKHRFPTDVPMD